MANLCQKLITACIGADCDNPIFQGADSKAWIINKSQIDHLVYSQTNPNIITEIVMKQYDDDGTDVDYPIYTIEQISKTPFTGTTSAMAEGNVQNTMTETFAFTVPDNCPTAAMLLDNMMNGRFMVIFKNEFTGSDNQGQYQVIGSKKALICNAMERDLYSDDTDSAWSVTLVSEKAPNSAMFIVHTDTTGDTPVVDTEAYLDGMVACE